MPPMNLFELKSLSKAESFYFPHRTSRSLVSEKILQTYAWCDVTNWYKVKQSKLYFCE